MVVPTKGYMKSFIALLLILLMSAQSAFAVDDTFFDYQNYNHGYCPDCNYCPCRCGGGSCPNNSCETPAPYPQDPPPCPPGAPCGTPTPCAAPCAPAPCDPCDPCAPVCGTECGISVCAIVVGIAALAAAAAIIICSSNGS